MKHKLGLHAAARNHFEANDEFEANFNDKHLKALLDAYNEGSRYASHACRMAVSDPGEQSAAIWAEASANTLDYVLALLKDGEFNAKPWKLPSERA